MAKEDWDKLSELKQDFNGLLKREKTTEIISNSNKFVNAEEKVTTEGSSGEVILEKRISRKMCSCGNPVSKFEDLRRCENGHIGCRLCVVTMCPRCEKVFCNEHLVRGRRYKERRYCQGCWNNTLFRRLFGVNIDA